MVKRVRRRGAWRTPVAIVGALAIGAFVYVLASSPLETNDKFSSVVAAVIAVVGAFATAMKWLHEEPEPIDHDHEAALLAGALLRRWRPELEHRAGRSDGPTISLRWQQRRDSVTASNPVTSRGNLRQTTNLGGALRGDLDQAVLELAEKFQGVANQRLVLLGEPGAGKTFLTLALTVGLLRSHSAGSRVPVLLSLTSWDPIAQSLDKWMVTSLAEENYSSNTDIPTALMDAGLVLPVLDGLDEIPKHVRRQAVSKINDTLRGQRPIVLTCRSTDYDDVLASGAPEVLRAPVVEVQPLAPADIVNHLRTANNRPGAWATVIEHVEANEHSPLTQALCTPLMLSLFISGSRTSDPTLLLTDPDLDNRLAVEDRLIDVLSNSMDQAKHGEGRRWLTYLAQQLHEHGTPNLSWWALAAWASSRARIGAAILAGLVLGLGTAAVDAVLPVAPPKGLVRETLNPWFMGVSAMLVFSSASSVVSRIVIPSRHEPVLARRRFVQAFAQSNRMAFACSAALAVLLWLGFGDEPGMVTNIGAAVGVLAGVGFVIGLGMGLHGYWAARGHRLAVTTPRDLLCYERKSSLVAAVAVALVVGLGLPFAAAWGGTVGGHLGKQVTLWLGQPVVLDRGLPRKPEHVSWLVDGVHVPELVVVSVLVGMVAGGCVLLARPWTRFHLARIDLALRRQLPLRLVEFLDRAHQHELLRANGGGYQFWHIRMQERLVATAPDEPANNLRKVWSALLVYTASVAAVVALIVVGIAQPPSCPDTGVPELDEVTSRVVAGNASACLGLVVDTYSLDLRTTGQNDAASYLIVGQFDLMTPSQRAELTLPMDQPAGKYRVRYVELSNAIPSLDVVPALARQLMADIEGKALWRDEAGPHFGQTVVVENGVVRVIDW